MHRVEAQVVLVAAFVDLERVAHTDGGRQVLDEEGALELIVADLVEAAPIVGIAQTTLQLLIDARECRSCCCGFGTLVFARTVVALVVVVI